MFIDYVPLMLVNMVAGLALLALAVARGLGQEGQEKWAPGFAMTGLVALACGLHMTWTWPLPGSYNVAYGETSVLFGVLFLGAALALAKNWSLVSVAVYALFAGAVAIVIGAGIVVLGMTNEPKIAGLGFVLTGLGGALILPVVGLRRNLVFRILAVLALGGAALIWSITASGAYVAHLVKFAKWTPLIMR